MKYQPTQKELLEALIDLLFILENDSNLKNDSMYKDYKRTVLADVENLDIYTMYDRLLDLEQSAQDAKPAYKSHYLN